MPRKKTPEGQKPEKRSKKRRSFLFRLLRLGFAAAIWSTIVALFFLAYYLHDLPDTKKLTQKTGNYQIRLLSADGQLITTLGNLYGEELSYEDFPANLIDAVIATEDRRFFEHFGFDVYGFGRAMLTNIKARKVVQGGSTITQQLAKVAFLSPERTVKRKVQELMLALWLEQTFTKKEILTMYLNRVYLGSGYFGVGAAARGYFAKDARDMNLTECAMIAGLLKAPSRFSPFTNPDLAQKRTQQILVNLVDAGYISVATAVNVGSVVTTRPRVSDSRLYFADWLANQIPDYIGVIDADMEIITTLDLRLQQFAESAIRDIMSTRGVALNAGQAALLALSPRGEILAMVGGKDYYKSQFNRTTMANRQPGSSFKFFVYLAALEAGFLPHDTFIDEPITIEDLSQDWSPENYYENYRGKVTIEEAFADSINTVAVQVSERIGRERVISMAQRLGITNPLPNIPSIALGTAEVTLMEMTQAYATLPNEGYRVEAYGIKEIHTQDGQMIYNRRGSYSSRILDKEVVAKMNVLLKAVMERGTGRNTRLLRETAGKSGTTQDFRDAWFIGFTPQVVTGVWVGNDDNTPMDSVTGSGLSGQIWKQFMKQTHHNLPSLTIPTSVGWFDWATDKWNDQGSENSVRRSFWDKLIDSIETEAPENQNATPPENQP